MQLTRMPTRVVPIFAGLMAGLFISELNETIFSTALPTVVGDLDGVDHMLWVTTAYILAATITMPVYGKLSDLVGRKPLFLAGLAIFSVGSIIGGLAPGMGLLILGRVVQGLGSGGLLILVQAIIADVVPARQRARYLSAMGAVFAASSLLGPVLGGWLTEMMSWRWAFWINLPLGALAMTLAALFLPADARPEVRLKLDVWGVTTMATAVTALVLVAAWGGTTYAWSSPVIVTLALVAVVAAVIFVRVERRAAQPLIPLHLFANRNFSVPTVVGLVMAVAMFGTIGYLPTYLQMVSGLGADPLRSADAHLDHRSGRHHHHLGPDRHPYRSLPPVADRRCRRGRGRVVVAVDPDPGHRAVADRGLPVRARSGHRLCPAAVGPHRAELGPVGAGRHRDRREQLLP